MREPTYLEISKLIDHSLLQPMLTESELEAGLDAAIRYQVASVCIMPFYLPRAAERLAGSGVRPSTTIGFPHGGQTSGCKLQESQEAIESGCQELDMVINISQALSGNWDYVAAEIKAIVQLAHAADRQVKVIFENCYLDDSHKVRLCQICSEAKADWVKTSTGYGTGGATLEDLRLMLSAVGPGVQVKAAGGVRDVDRLLEVWRMGITRVGTSQTAALLEGVRQRLGLAPLEVSRSSLQGDGGGAAMASEY
jgi:deoxyribose-phosphate aldolase